MADVSITAANVVRVSGAVEEGTAGESMTGGMLVYKKDADSKFYMCSSDATAVGVSAEVDNVYGVLLNAGVAAGQPCDVQTNGVITIGGTVVAGTPYFLSDTSLTGKICPHADLIATNWVSFFGIGASTTTVRLGIRVLTVQVAA